MSDLLEKMKSAEINISEVKMRRFKLISNIVGFGVWVSALRLWGKLHEDKNFLFVKQNLQDLFLPL